MDIKTVRAGRVFKVHLAGDVVLDGTTIAASGTLAQLVVLDRVTEPSGTPAIVVAIGSFNVLGGELPVTPVTPTVRASLDVGSRIAARTMGSVERRNGRIVIRVPLPFTLPADAPNSAFTPVPARTANPRGVTPPARVRRPTPRPSPSPTESPSPEPTPGDAG